MKENCMDDPSNPPYLSFPAIIAGIITSFTVAQLQELGGLAVLALTLVAAGCRAEKEVTDLIRRWKEKARKRREHRHKRE